MSYELHSKCVWQIYSHTFWKLSLKGAIMQQNEKWRHFSPASFMILTPKFLIFWKKWWRKFFWRFFLLSALTGVLPLFWKTYELVLQSLKILGHEDAYNYQNGAFFFQMMHIFCCFLAKKWATYRKKNGAISDSRWLIRFYMPFSNNIDPWRHFLSLTDSQRE